MEQPDIADLSLGELWEQICQTMQDGLAAGDGITAPAGPFREVAAMLEELVARDPDWNFSEIAEFRTILERALAGKPGVTGHA